MNEHCTCCAPCQDRMERQAYQIAHLEDEIAVLREHLEAAEEAIDETTDRVLKSSDAIIETVKTIRKYKAAKVQASL